MIWPLPIVTNPPRRRLWLSLLAFVLIALAAVVPGLYLWTQYHRRLAERAIERFAFDEAQHRLDFCLRFRPRNAALHLLAARVARRRDAYDEAEKHLAESVQLSGINPTLSLERMLLTAQQGEFDGLEPTLRARTRSDDPDAVLVLEALAKGYANRYWDQNTLVCLNILLERDPNHPVALLMRAQLWESRARRGEGEREADAFRDYQKAVELMPTFETVLGFAGSLYRVGRPCEAAQLYERLRSSQPANPAVLLGFARCRYALHEVDEAERLLDELLATNPHDAAALLERGRFALHDGQYERAENWLRQSVAAAPPYECGTLRLLCRCLEAANKTAEARAYQDQLRTRETKVLAVERLIARLNREPRDVELRYQAAKELMRLGREQDGVAALFFVLAQQPRHGPVHEALANYFERIGQTGRAARHRQAVLSNARATGLSR